MPELSLDLEELVTLIRRAWPERWARGRILHVHRNALKLNSGAIVHLRVLVQQIEEPDHAHKLGCTDDYMDDIHVDIL